MIQKQRGDKTRKEIEFAAKKLFDILPKLNSRNLKDPQKEDQRFSDFIKYRNIDSLIIFH